MEEHKGEPDPLHVLREFFSRGCNPGDVVYDSKRKQVTFLSVGQDPAVSFPYGVKVVGRHTLRSLLLLLEYLETPTGTYLMAAHDQRLPFVRLSEKAGVLAVLRGQAAALPSPESAAREPPSSNGRVSYDAANGWSLGSTVLRHARPSSPELEPAGPAPPKSVPAARSRVSHIQAPSSVPAQNLRIRTAAPPLTPTTGDGDVHDSWRPRSPGGSLLPRPASPRSSIPRPESPRTDVKATSKSKSPSHDQELQQQEAQVMKSGVPRQRTSSSRKLSAVCTVGVLGATVWWGRNYYPNSGVSEMAHSVVDSVVQGPVGDKWRHFMSAAPPVLRSDVEEERASDDFIEEVEEDIENSKELEERSQEDSQGSSSLPDEEPTAVDIEPSLETDSIGSDSEDSRSDAPDIEVEKITEEIAVPEPFSETEESQAELESQVEPAEDVGAVLSEECAGPLEEMEDSLFINEAEELDQDASREDYVPEAVENELSAVDEGVNEGTEAVDDLLDIMSHPEHEDSMISEEGNSVSNSHDEEEEQQQPNSSVNSDIAVDVDNDGASMRAEEIPVSPSLDDVSSTSTKPPQEPTSVNHEVAPASEEDIAPSEAVSIPIEDTVTPEETLDIGVQEGESLPEDMHTTTTAAQEDQALLVPSPPDTAADETGEVGSQTAHESSESAGEPALDSSNDMVQAHVDSDSNNRASPQSSDNIDDCREVDMVAAEVVDDSISSTSPQDPDNIGDSSPEVDSIDVGSSPDADIDSSQTDVHVNLDAEKQHGAKVLASTLLSAHQRENRAPEPLSIKPVKVVVSTGNDIGTSAADTSQPVHRPWSIGNWPKNEEELAPIPTKFTLSALKAKAASALMEYPLCLGAPIPTQTVLESGEIMGGCSQLVGYGSALLLDHEKGRLVLCRANDTSGVVEERQCRRGPLWAAPDGRPTFRVVGTIAAEIGARIFGTLGRQPAKLKPVLGPLFARARFGERFAGVRTASGNFFGKLRRRKGSKKEQTESENVDVDDLHDAFNMEDLPVDEVYVPHTHEEGDEKGGGHDTENLAPVKLKLTDTGCLLLYRPRIGENENVELWRSSKEEGEPGKYSALIGPNGCLRIMRGDKIHWESDGLWAKISSFTTRQKS